MNNQHFKRWCQEYTASSSYRSAEKPRLMGILNITPDSFSDGGQFLSLDKALKQAQLLQIEGADIIDIGGESTRPGALPVSSEEEMDRVIPLIERIRAESDICLSIDTTKVCVMKAAIAAGANIINDISALRDGDSLATAAMLGVPVCLMHMQGSPETMQNNPSYRNGVVFDITTFFQNQIARCVEAGIPREHIILDPGFGFGKSNVHNLQIVKHLHQFTQHGLPILLGVSRKSTIGSILNQSAQDRLIGGAVLSAIATLNGVAILRTHDIELTNQALLMAQAIMQADIKE